MAAGAMLASVAAAMKRVHCRLWIKTHPGERRVEALEAVCREFFTGQEWRFLKNTARASDFMKECRLVMGCESGAMIEALIWGAPTICIDYSGKPFVYDLVEKEASLPACHPDGLAAVMETALSQSYREEFYGKRRKILEHYFSNQGSAAKKTAQFIGTMLGGGTRVQ